MTLILIGSVSAADIDANDTEIISASDNDEIVNIANDLKTLSSSGNATYSDLRNEIRNGGNYTELQHAYYYKTKEDDSISITITNGNRVIDGKGAIIDMNGSGIAALKLEASNVTIKNLTIKNAKYEGYITETGSYSGNGAAIIMNQSIVENCNFINNMVNNNGGALFGSGTVKNCNFVDNYGDRGGAIYLTSGIVENCNFTHNTGKIDGGAIYFQGTGTITNCNFIHNTVGDWGGAIYISSGVVKKCNFTNNYAAMHGGAIYFINTGTVENCNFTNNQAGNYNGGAVYFTSGTITNCNFTNNTAGSMGGAAHFTFKGNITNSNFINNLAEYDGAAIHIVSTGTVTNCNFINNIATGIKVNGGGAITIQNSGNMTNCNFTNNQGEFGGGVYFMNGNVENCNFVNNTARNSGGGIFTDYANIANCNFFNNYASTSGGAINVISSATINYCNFQGNKARFGSAIRHGKSLNDKSISNSVLLNNRANANTLDIVQKENKIEITFIGENNYLNAIWGNNKGDVNFNNVTYWGANGITNTNNSPTLSRFANEAGQNMTIMWIVDGIAFNMTKVTDINGKIVLDIIAGNSTLTARHNADSYYTQIETTKTFQKTGNESSLELSASNWTATATVNPNNASGNVIFTVQNETGIVKTFETTLNNGIAEFDLTGLVAGEYNITAIYTGNINTHPSKDNMTYALLYGKSTYSELSREIGSGGDIKLKYDYYTFDYGPTIEITTPNSIIDGNGAVIDMAGSNINALIITDSNVTIKNLTIKNANINNKGGAIYFTNPGAIENCNFINNTASDGGAVYFINGGNVSNCNFTNNSATRDGGAICFKNTGNVSNCNFNNNTAYFDGGAICFKNTGNVSNCNFSNNQATTDNGGALYFEENGEVTECNFSNNKAPSYDGGAICFWTKGKLTDSSFKDNYANYGGAISIALCSVDNCTFTGNNATVASAIYCYSNSGTKTISNSIFLNNRANADTIQIVENGNNLEITLTGKNNLINAIYCKEYDQILFTNVTYWGAQGIANTGNSTITLPRSNNEAGQNITVFRIVNDNILNTTKVTDIDGKIVLDAVTGSYLIVARHEEDSYYTHADAIKTNMQFYVNLTSMTSNNRTVNITAKSNIKHEIVQGKLLFILENGDEINANYTSNGTWWAEYTFDEYGEYDVTASYSKLEKVTINNATISLTKLDSTLTLDNITLDYGDSINISVTTQGATGITAKINENEVDTNEYIIPISGLNAGNYTLTVTTIPDEDHNPVTKNATITVNKIDSTLTVDDVIFDYDSSGSANVSFTGAKGINAYIINQPKAIVNVNDNTITISALDAGTYTLTVTTLPDGNHKTVTKKATVTVNKIDSTITFNETEINYGESITIITEGSIDIIAEIDGQPVAVDNFTVPIFGVIAGKYTLTVTTVPDANHNPITKTATITVNKINTSIIVDVIEGAMKNEVNIIANVNETATGFIEFIIKDMIVYLPVNDGKSVYDAILPGGDYNITVTYLGDGIFNYNFTSKAFTVVDPAKLNTTIKSGIEIDENTVTVTANVDANATGFVEFIIAGKKYYAPINEGKAVLTNDFIPGTYSGNVNYLGDENFNPASTLVYFTVIEQNATLDNTPIEVAVVTINNDVIVIAHVNETATGLIEFIIEDRVVYVPVTNGEAYSDITLPEGNYTTTVTYMGDSKFNPNSTSKTFTVTDPVKLNTTIKCDVLIDENTVTITANVDEDATGLVEFIIAGKKYYAPINEGKAVLSTDFITGTYSGNVNYLGDEVFNPASTLIYFTVIEQNATLDNTSIEVAVVTINNDVSITAKVNESATGLIEFIIEDNVVYIPITNGDATYNVILPEGNYKVAATYMGDSKFNPNSTSKTFTVTNPVKLNTTIKCDVTIDKNTVTVTANVDTNATGFVEFIIAGKKYYAPINEGKAILSNDFIAGTYSGNANYLGDEVFNPASTLIYFTVIEQNATLDNTSIEVAVVTINNDVIIIAHVNETATGLIEFIIEDRVVYVPVTNGEAYSDITLPEGNYTTTVTYMGDSKFNPNSTSKTFTVTNPVKLNTTIKCDVAIDKNTVTVTANVDTDATGFVEFIIAGKKYYAPINEGKAILSNDFIAGTYSGNVNYLGDEVFNPASTLIYFTVTQQNATLDNTPIDVAISTIHNDVSITAKVNASATGLIEFLIEDKVVYLPVTNGEATYDVILQGGNYNITVTYLGDSKFNPNSTSKTFTVVDPVKMNTAIECNVIVDENIVSITANVDESATGFVEIELNGTSIFAKVENGKAFIDTSLPNGNYTVRVTYLGDETFNSNTTAVSFTVAGTPLIIPKASEFSDVTIDDDLNIYIVLKDETGKVIGNAPITYTVNGTAGTTTTAADGSFTIKAVNGAKVEIKYAGNEDILPTNLTLTFNVPDVPVVVKTVTHFDIPDRAITINGYAVDGPANEQGIYYATTLLDANGKPVSNVYIEFAVNNKIYNRTTYENGSFKPYKLNMVRAGRYTMAFNFAGDDNYTNAFACVCVDLDKKPITIKASAKTYKAATKTKKYTVTLSTIKGVDGKMHLSPKKVTLKVNGKTYTGKTNSKGIALFKITNLKKKAKYKAVISYAGDKTYEAATKSVILTVK